jgi:hypothetical protein
MSVTYGEGKFVAVANSGSTRVMTSPDGITWTAQSAASNDDWSSVTYAQGLFAAVSWSGTIMTSGTFAGSPSAAEGSAPLPVTQQLGRPIVGTCAEAAPASLNWAGVASGGWGESWAQWMNGGLGGAVCTRTLVYSTSQSRWILG